MHLNPPAGIAYALPIYLGLWGAAVGVLVSERSGAWMFPAMVMSVFATLTLVAWFATRRAVHVSGPALRSASYTWAVAAYLVFFGIVVVGFGFSWVRMLPTAQQQAITMLSLKLATMAVIPLVLMRAFGIPLRSLVLSSKPSRQQLWLLLAMGTAVLVLMALATPALPQLQQLAPPIMVLVWAVPLNALWVLLEAALCEEILFRVFLLTQLKAWMRQTKALVVGAVIFGLAHVPGLWFRGDPSMDAVDAAATQVSLLWAIAYSIAVLSPPALLFGVLWLRTRNLALIVLLHTAINFLPTLPGFITLWGGG